MAFTELYCDAAAGANVNGGSDAGSPSMSDTAGTGAVSTVTHQYTSVATNGSVAVGQFISIYSGAATTPAFTSRITAVSGGGGSVWVITYSTTAKIGTEPTTGATYKAQVGGAWKGPNGADGWPVGSVSTTLVNSSNNPPRVNLLAGTYAITAGVTQGVSGVTYEGYTATPGDGGRATIDGSTNAILLWNNTGGSITKNLIFSNNGTTGSNNGLALAGTLAVAIGCVAHDIRGYGIALTAASTEAIECEAYLCNGSNTATLAGGFQLSGGGATLTNCIAHDNAGSNTAGAIHTAATVANLINCIFDTNGTFGGVYSSNAGQLIARNCDLYNNVGAGFDLSNNTGSSAILTNCNLVKNGGTGVLGNAAGLRPIYVINCGFGSGTQANGATTSGSSIQESGSVTYASNTTPWNAPTTGDFRINLAAAVGTGRGTFTETQASYTGTAANPVIGSCQVAGYPPVANVTSGVTYANAAYTGTEAAGGVIGSRAFLGMGVGA